MVEEMLIGTTAQEKFLLKTPCMEIIMMSIRILMNLRRKLRKLLGKCFGMDFGIKIAVNIYKTIISACNLFSIH